MILERQSDGTYTQIGFIKSKDTENIDTIVDTNGNVYFTQGFNREINGTPPLTLDAIGKNVLMYKIYGNSIQNGTPSPDNPVEVQSVGEPVFAKLYDSDGFRLTDSDGYKLCSQDVARYCIPVVTSGVNRESLITNIYLDEPLRKIGDYADVIDFERGIVERKIKKLVFDGSETFQLNSNNTVFVTFIDDIGVFMNRNSPILSSHYQTASIYDDLYSRRMNYGVYFGASLADRICIRNKDMTTVESFKEHLTEQYNAGTPVTVYYALAEPTTETLALPKIPTFSGTTIISTDTEVEPSDIEITYKGTKPQNN